MITAQDIVNADADPNDACETTEGWPNLDANILC